MLILSELISCIKPLDTQAMEKCQLRVDNLTKPLNSLHYFEKMACQLAGITRNPRPQSLSKSLIVMVGVQQTTEVKIETQEALATLTVFAQHVSANLVKVKIDEDTLTKEAALKAIFRGVKIAECEIARGAQVLGLGNLADATKVSEAAEASWTLDLLDKNDSLDVLVKLGNMQLATLVGVILGGAVGRVAIVLDGQATVVAALLATKLAPGVRDYLLGSHYSAEPAQEILLENLGIPAYLRLDIGTGDGRGAVLGMSLINASLHVLNDMKTFGEAEVATAQDGPGALKQNKDIRD